jgi:stearoyl-CoA desaturase (Delta-9 desaturase)
LARRRLQDTALLVPTPILIFFIGHWVLAIFFQTFFHHRYGAHKMFTMSKAWERVFHLLTYLFQGASYLQPRAYAILHRMHHAYSDTEKDPHSPWQYNNVFTMMWATKKVYHALAWDRFRPEPRFEGGYPEWHAIDRVFARGWLGPIGWGTGYVIFYLFFATAWWQFLLLPVHFFMGPIHGAIVNWFGHKWGYTTFDNGDKSKNTVPLDAFTMGELFQNNHHKYANRPNFAVRWFEIDPTYQVIRILALLRIIRFAGARAEVSALPAGAAESA